MSNLDTLQSSTRIINPDGTPTLQFQLWWQRIITSLRDADDRQTIAFDTLDELVTADGGLQTQIAISASFPVPTMTLTAADAGSDVTITIAAHTRIYPNETMVAISGGSVTGLAFSTTYAVYYDDATLLEGSPTFEATTDLETGQSNYAEGRHYVGTVVTPANGAGNTTGGAPPPSSGYTAGTSSVVIT